MNFDQSFWDNKYQTGQTGWDLGSISTPLKTYFDQLENKNIFILIPGAGNAYEAEYLFQNRFQNVFIADISPKACQQFQERVPNFPPEHILCVDFFELNQTFDLIIEQTFFCALNPILREKYVEKMYQLLSDKGKLVGLLFDDVLNTEHPPFGGCKEEYMALFSKNFNLEIMETATNSITPRSGRELFIKLTKK